eukprot:TRINITY_DN11758_c0_g1_i1.p1 TRINITY_DN11758_c0_g1~~TRINITY_DN11758_c0_g1_i1.p1  ORF type:complete len:567 (+),score=138.54 TRINITY_DN11758_c0_g1_i1:70-1770(+)
MKYIFVTGGVLSGLGKGVIASSCGNLLRSYGLRVTSIKIDPYLNVDAGTMSPFEHGEVYVLDDGGEADLDLGNYERFVGSTLTKDNNITTGKIYKSVIEKERRGDYLGKTVQVVPHICNEIQDWIERVAHTPTDGTDQSPNFCVVEVGGTVGDIESMPFIEALRQFQFRVGKENFCLIHVSLIPILGVVGEQKTKPTQNSIRQLRALGLSPDLIACRCSSPLSPSTRSKVSSFCHVSEEHVIDVHDVDNIYRVPLLLKDQGVPSLIFKVFNIDQTYLNCNMDEWKQIADKYTDIENQENCIKIAMVGKYTDLLDTYLSVIKSLKHASIYIKKKMKILWIESQNLEEGSDTYDESWELLKSADGILIPGGFGIRGVEGKIAAARYSRENDVPFLGICLGLQIAVIEYARNVVHLEGATSEEFDENSDTQVVIFMPEISTTHMGGTMRLGKRETIFVEDFVEGSVNAKLHKIIRNEEKSVSERHRHRYEVNPEYVQSIQDAGLMFVGQDTTGTRQEIIELPNHPYFVGTQYHPEFRSRPNLPSPLFVGLLLASCGELQTFLVDNTEEE